MVSPEPPSAQDLIAHLGHDLVRLRALRGLTRLARLRVVVSALQRGATTEVLADVLDLEPKGVPRVVRRARSSHEVTQVCATEIMNLAAAGFLGREEMMRRLQALTYSGGTNDPTGHEGYARGTWDEVHFAVGQGLLTDAEYEQLRSSGSQA